MGWEDAHLHKFVIGDQRLGPGHLEGVSDERQVRVHEVVQRPGDSFVYVYDFGDSWEHEILVEEMLPPTGTARCLGGERSCPAEDCGGAWGYAEMLAALADPSAADHEHVNEWIGLTSTPRRSTRRLPTASFGVWGDDVERRVGSGRTGKSCRNRARKCARRGARGSETPSRYSNSPRMSSAVSAVPVSGSSSTTRVKRSRLRCWRATTFSSMVSAATSR